MILYFVTQSTFKYNIMKNVRIHLSVFLLLLLLSGITAFPIRSEIAFLHEYREILPPLLSNWITQLYTNISSTPLVMLYGTDWLAFAHIVIALFFIPVYIDPEKHKINLKIGMLACLLIFPLAFICGPLRNIPFFHQLIDCSFGVFGFLYLYFIFSKINQIHKKNENLPA